MSERRFPARALATPPRSVEWLTYGEYRTLDLTPFHHERIARGRPIVERAVI